MLEHFCLAGTLGFTVYGQLIIKSRAIKHASVAAGDGMAYLVGMLGDALVWSGLASAGGAALCWIIAVRALPVAVAYPFMALSFVFVPLGASILFDEPVNAVRGLGLLLIVAGVALHAIAR